MYIRKKEVRVKEGGSKFHLDGDSLSGAAAGFSFSRRDISPGRPDNSVKQLSLFLITIRPKVSIIRLHTVPDFAALPPANPANQMITVLLARAEEKRLMLILLWGVKKKKA